MVQRKALMADKNFLIEEEMIIVRNSGEIPEIAYHGSLYYLTKDPEGPKIELKSNDLYKLKNQVVARYKEIMLRDLTPENRDKNIYRGLKRTIVNWDRLCTFCDREDHHMEGVQKVIASALRNFLHQEMADLQNGTRKSCINCAEKTLSSFIKEIGVDPALLPKGWQEICL